MGRIDTVTMTAILTWAVMGTVTPLPAKRKLLLEEEGMPPVPVDIAVIRMDIVGGNSSGSFQHECPFRGVNHDS